MKKQILVLAVLTALSHGSVAEADLAFPGEPRPPRYPRPPVEISTEQEQTRATVEIVLVDTDEDGEKLLMEFGFPEAGTYAYSIYDRDTQASIQSSEGVYEGYGPGTVAEEFRCGAPEEGAPFHYLLTVDFTIHKREMTNFGAKQSAETYEQHVIRHIVIERLNGETVVRVSKESGSAG